MGEWGHQQKEDMPQPRSCPTNPPAAQQRVPAQPLSLPPSLGTLPFPPAKPPDRQGLPTPVSSRDGADGTWMLSWSLEGPSAAAVSATCSTSVLDSKGTSYTETGHRSHGKTSPPLPLHFSPQGMSVCFKAKVLQPGAFPKPLQTISMQLQPREALACACWSLCCSQLKHLQSIC